jgi:hypothetical protein
LYYYRWQSVQNTGGIFLFASAYAYCYIYIYFFLGFLSRSCNFFGCLVGVVIVFGELLLFLGCLLGAYLFCEFFWVSCGFGVLLLLLGCLMGAYLCFLGFWGFSLSFGFPLFLWASWVVPLYT